jgi:hypothetical protein
MRRFHVDTILRRVSTASFRRERAVFHVGQRRRW